MPRCIPLLWSLLTAVLVTVASAQVKVDTADFTSERIRIPTPDGFAPVSSQFPRLFERFVSTETAENVVLEVYVDDSHLNDLIRNEDVDLIFYTKVSAPRGASRIDKRQFADMVDQLKSQISGFFDPRSPDLAAATRSIRNERSKLDKEESAFDVKTAKDLGVFEQRSNVFSHMVLLNVESRRGTIPLLATSSVLLLNGRLVFVSTYRRLAELQDAETLRDFAGTWTEAIVAANDVSPTAVR